MPEFFHESVPLPGNFRAGRAGRISKGFVSQYSPIGGRKLNAKGIARCYNVPRCYVEIEMHPKLASIPNDSGRHATAHESAIKKLAAMHDTVP